MPLSVFVLPLDQAGNMTSCNFKVFEPNPDITRRGYQGSEMLRSHFFAHPSLRGYGEYGVLTFTIALLQLIVACDHLQ